MSIVSHNKDSSFLFPKKKHFKKLLKMYLALRYLPLSLCQHNWRDESPFCAAQERLSLIFIITRFLFDDSLYTFIITISISRHEHTMRDAWENVHLMEIGFFISFSGSEISFFLVPLLWCKWRILYSLYFKKWHDCKSCKHKRH